MRISEIQKRLPILENRIKNAYNGELCNQGVYNALIAKENAVKRMERAMENETFSDSKEIKEHWEIIKEQRIDIKLLKLISY